MRRFRAFLFLAGRQLKQPWFWIFLFVFVLLGPVFVVLHSGTDLEEREQRPLLSESATIDHFNTGMFSRMSYIEVPILFFRDSDSEPAPEFSVPPAFAAGWRLLPRSNTSEHRLWSFPLTGSLSDVYGYLLPIFMIVAGIVAFPSRRRLDALRVLLPCGRGGCFLMIAGVLALQVVLLGVLSGVATWVGLSLTQGISAGTARFVVQYFASVTAYGFGFAMLGIVLAELIRNRPIALMIGLLLIVGIWEYVSTVPGQLYRSTFQSITGMTPSDPNLNPIYGYIGVLLLPPQSKFDSVGLSIERLASGVEDPYVTRSDLRRGLLLSWGALAVFAGSWLVIGWLVFPRTVRLIS